MEDALERLEACYTGAVHDVMRALGLKDFTLPPTIAALVPGTRLCGPAWTFAGRAVAGADADRTLVEWTRVLGRAPAGHVVVCQPNDSTIAHMGELSAETLMHRGIKGYVVDGGCRDAERVIGMGFPVFCRYLTPLDIVGRWLPEGLGAPIVIGGVTIATGDVILADRDGVVVVPEAAAAEVATKTHAVMATENRVRTAILAGMDPTEAYLKFGKF